MLTMDHLIFRSADGYWAIAFNGASDARPGLHYSYFKLSRN